MPLNKNALLRFRIIDACLTNPQRKYPSLEAIVEKIEQQLEMSLSHSQFSKDIQQMKRIYNAPIRYDRNRNGYCYTEPGFSIREFPLTHEEIEALDFSTALFHQLKGTRLFNQFESAINKVIEGYRISKILGRSEMQILQVEEPLKEETSHWLEQILKAIVEKRSLCMHYQGFGKEGKDHELSPYLLKEYRNRWYVVGFTNRTEQVLVFALDRIMNLGDCRSKYVADGSFEPEQFFKYSMGITQFHDAEPQKVVLSFTPSQAAYVLSQPLHHSQKVILETDAAIQVALQVYVSQELIMTVLSYGTQVRVLAPDNLKIRIKETIEQMNALYKTKST